MSDDELLEHLEIAKHHKRDGNSLIFNVNEMEVKKPNKDDINRQHLLSKNFDDDNFIEKRLIKDKYTLEFEEIQKIEINKLNINQCKKPTYRLNKKIKIIKNNCSDSDEDEEPEEIKKPSENPIIEVCKQIEEPEIIIKEDIEEPEKPEEPEEPEEPEKPEEPQEPIIPIKTKLISLNKATNVLKPSNAELT